MKAMLCALVTIWSIGALAAESISLIPLHPLLATRLGEVEVHGSAKNGSSPKVTLSAEGIVQDLLLKGPVTGGCTNASDAETKVLLQYCPTQKSAQAMLETELEGIPMRLALSPRNIQLLRMEEVLRANAEHFAGLLWVDGAIEGHPIKLMFVISRK